MRFLATAFGLLLAACTFDVTPVVTVQKVEVVVPAECGSLAGVGPCDGGADAA